MGDDLLPGDMVCNHPKNVYAFIKRAYVPEGVWRIDGSLYDFNDRIAMVLSITEIQPNKRAKAQRVCLLLHSDGTYGWECEQRLAKVDP